MTRDEVEAGLRAWARGLYPMEAGAELLIRTGLIHRGDVRGYCGPSDPPSSVVWVDTDKLVDELDNGGIQVAMSSGEFRLFHIAVSFLDYRIKVPLEYVFSGLGEDNMDLVIRAVQHANNGERGGDWGFPR